MAATEEQETTPPKWSERQTVTQNRFAKNSLEREEAMLREQRKRKKKEKKKKKHAEAVLKDGIPQDERRKLIKKAKKRKKSEEENRESPQVEETTATESRPSKRKRTLPETKQRSDKIYANGSTSSLSFDHKYVLAPMVGASELAFRLLCRKYGAQLAYTPMMSSTEFASDAEYRRSEFQTVAEDRPLVCHFSANNPADFAEAARLCQDNCDAIDLNLGCPQRTAYLGHFGSYLLGKDDRKLVLSIVRAGAEAVSIPIFVKIRLLDTVDQTIELIKQLRDAGASLIAVHARYRASFERKGPGARDGPALLDQILEIKKSITDIPIIANGNVTTYDDVVNNLKNTTADGIMSAEGILDNPALFLPRLGANDDSGKSSIQIDVLEPSPLINDTCMNEKGTKTMRKLVKKLREVEAIEGKASRDGAKSLNDDQRKKLARKADIVEKIDGCKTEAPTTETTTRVISPPTSKRTSLAALYDSADDPTRMAAEYLSLVRRYPVKIRSVIFHTRRILKDLLKQYQLMDECVTCQTLDEVEKVIQKTAQYRDNPGTFIYDQNKAKQEKEALEMKRREEGKRKAFEARMMRKAKREGKVDLEHYLRIGSEVPTTDTILMLTSLSKEEKLHAWKKDHAQHCMAYHLEPGGCKRDRACAFLHISCKGATTFVESDEVAG